MSSSAMEEYGPADLYGEASMKDAGGVKKSVSRGVDNPFAAMPTGGTNGYVPDNRLFGHNRVDGIKQMREQKIGWGVASNDVMTPTDAGAMMKRIFDEYKITGASDGVSEAYYNAVLFYHTLNSGSVVQPNRGYITVMGKPVQCETLMATLDVNVRRFFRAYADEVRNVNRMVRTWQNDEDVGKRDMYAALDRIVRKRGMERHPDLVHDSAEYCTGLTKEETMAVQRAKLAALPTENFADSVGGEAGAAQKFGMRAERRGLRVQDE